MEIIKNFDLTKYNTLGVRAEARFFVEIKHEEDLPELFKTLEFRNNEKLFLGGGSNILFTKNFDGIVILNRLKGIEILKEDSENVFVKSMGGEWWNDLVNFTVERGLWGIENLALIPGTVGATPVQNIGAYGVELKDTLESVEAYEIKTSDLSTSLEAKKITFTNEECEFGYRDSIFKTKLKEQCFISAIVLKLNKKKKLNINYKAIMDYLEKNPEGKSTSYGAGNIEIKNSKEAANIIAEIRRSKLPDPKILGNAGSFFKNVYVTKEKLEELKNKYPEIPSFAEGLPAQAGQDFYKIPSGWLIEACGWKGKKVGNVGVHEKQALVIVNYCGATGEEIKNLADRIIYSVYEKFGLKLIPEVNFI